MRIQRHTQTQKYELNKKSLIFLRAQSHVHTQKYELDEKFLLFLKIQRNVNEQKYDCNWMQCTKEKSQQKRQTKINDYFFPK